MSDRYLELVNSRVGRSVAPRLGLPRPAVLRRYEPGAPLVPGPVLLGSAAGDGIGGIAGLLRAAGADVQLADREDARWAALVLDATGLANPA